jgi:hypothetical protein
MPWRKLPAWNSHAAIWLAGLAILMDLAFFYTLGVTTLALILNILVLGVAVVASLSWTPAAISAFRNGAAHADDKVILSVWGSWTVLLLQRIYVLGITIASETKPDGTVVRPAWLVESPINSLIVTLIIIIGCYASYATVTEAGAPKRERSWMVFCTGVAIGVVIGVLGLLVLAGRFFAFAGR